MSPGARAERLLAARLLELERRLDAADPKDADAIWEEYRWTFYLWDRAKHPKAELPAPITRAMLAERFHTSRAEGR